MKINDVIRTRRQALGLTQEALAQRVGVSAPAVNKWEKGLNYPDITLLPVLARTLGVDLNTLLSFQEDLSDQEIGEFLNTLAETAQTQGCKIAFALAQDKLRDFPNNDRLAYSVAGMLEGLDVLFASDDTRPPLQETALQLYQRCAGSADPQIREASACRMTAQCIQQGDTEEAERWLTHLSPTHPQRGELTASLRRKQGRQAEAWTLLEQDLFTRAHSLETLLLHLMDLSLEEGDQEQAQILCQAAEKTAAALGLSDYAALSAPLQLAITQEDGPKALTLLDRLLHSLSHPWVPALYRHLPRKNETEENLTLLLRPLLDQIQKDPDYAFLRAQPGYDAVISPYRALVSEPQ